MSSASTGLAPGIAAVRDALAAAAAEKRLALPRGGGTKEALSAPGDGCRAIEVATLSGILEYVPSEFTVTAFAGTPVAEVGAALAVHRQYLPFDPILVAAGSTLGGTIAAGVSGSGRVRYGGIRDFVLGVRFLDGTGTLVRGGGNVVKNAAGFDLPKLLVGSLGSLGIVVELTLKVFPAPEETATGRVDLGTLDDAVGGMRRLLAGPCEVDALDLEPPSRLWVRVAGRSKALAARLERALTLAAGGAAAAGVAPAAQRVDRAAAEAHWAALRELDWVPPGAAVVKVPIQLGRIAPLERALETASGDGAPRTLYTAAGQQALVTWPAAWSLDALDRLLDEQGLSGLVFRGAAARRRLGRKPGEAALERARQALDPERRFRDP